MTGGWSEAEKAKYGPWAVIAGGSNGTGEAYARELAATGINVLLISRRQETLDALAADLRQQYGIETRTLAQDLMAADAAQNILAASADLDVGLYISNAGADDLAAPFFSEPVERWRQLIGMNVLAVTEAVHGFGNRFLGRGHGGIVLMSSGAALSGIPYLQVYSATKSFEMVLTEALWSELAPSDVDITCVIAPAMDTPFFRRSITGDLLVQMQAAGIIFQPGDIARRVLADLPHKPLQLFEPRNGKSATEILEERLAAMGDAAGAGNAFAEERERAASAPIMC